MASTDPAPRPVFRLEGTDLRGSLSDDRLVTAIKAAVFQHGVVCIPGQGSVSAHELAAFADRIGTLLTSADSPFLSRSSDWVHDTLDGVWLAGNVDRHGGIHSDLRRSEYWHHDNDWANEKLRRIFNVLHTVVLPDTPGSTGFIDVRHMRETLTPAEGELLRDATTTLLLADIADYDVAHSGHIPPSKHSVLSTHPVSGLPVTYMSGGTITLASGVTVPAVSIIAPILDRQPLIIHDWAPGDVLVWDNLSVMHRSMGGFSGTRLLYSARSIWEA